MPSNVPTIFICFAAEDRYTIAEPIVYHLKNYGMNVWYDRYKLLLGDDRIEKNLKEGAGQCEYAIIVISQNIKESNCALEELSVLEKRYNENRVIIFPILYEIAPNELPNRLVWIKDLIFKEVDIKSGTREVCNHIICKITENLMTNSLITSINELNDDSCAAISNDIKKIIRSYIKIDYYNINSKISLLYATHIIIKERLTNIDKVPSFLFKTFDRLFTETQLNISVDYRDIWLLENVICLLLNYYIENSTESSISMIKSNTESN